MILYRAMCAEERNDTLRHNSPAFLRRYKWFSHDLMWIKSRVMGGMFGNSDQKPDRYVCLLKFIVPNECAKWFRRGKVEWELDRRVSHNVYWTSVEEVLL